MSVPNTSQWTLETLARHWEDRNEALWRASPQRYLEFGKSAISLGNPTLAYDILKVGLADFPDDIEIAYHTCLALVRSGASNLASQAVSELLPRIAKSNTLYADTLSLAGRVAKEYAGLAGDHDLRRKAALESAAHYQTAYETSDDYFPGINAATMSMLAGNSTNAENLASRVLTTCRSLSRTDGSEDHWLAATMGEANLLLGKENEATEWYTRARRAAKERYGDIASMRRQVMMLAPVVDGTASVLRVLDIPAVVAFAGHMIDTPDRTNPRFPGEIENLVASTIADTLEQLNAGIGYSSAACGADILFIEAMLERGGEANILLPFKREDFLETSVAFAGATWVKRFERVLERASSVRFATRESHLGDDCLFAYTSDLVTGSALLRAKQLTVTPAFLAVMEADQPRKTGGTGDTVNRWRGMGHDLEIIDLATVRDGAGGACSNSEPSEAPVAGAESKRLARDIRTMLFADVVGFSRLREEETPAFVVEFMGHVADTIARSKPKPSFCNTWGDGLFIVFEDVSAGARFALELRDSVLEKDWHAVGFPENVSIRIGMHAGPVFGARDPILGRVNYFGSHVNRAARIEPITPPGTVYVSEQAACLLATTGDDALTCDYMGATELAKKFGSGALYRLRRVCESS